LKILRVIARLNVGGPARHVVILDRGLRARGHDTLLVHGTVDEGEASLEHLASDAHLRSLKVPSLGRRVSPLSDVRALLGIIRAVFHESPDVVHTHTAKAGALGRIAALAFNLTRPRRRRCAVVHTFHGHVLDGYFSPRANRLVRGAERLLARVTDRIVTISPSQREDIVERFHVASSRQTTVVPLGLDLEPLAAGRGHSLRRELGIDERSTVFGYVGRLVPIKDLPTLGLAFARLLEQVPDAHLLVVGDGPARRDLERTISVHGVASRTHLLGWREDLPDIYATMDVCVLSSRSEGTPVALIEAMAAGLPVVATRVGGVPDVVVEGETGLLVPAGDAEALAAAMACLAGNPARRTALGACARSRALAQFGSERLVDDVDRLYAATLAQKRG
jgi:glycosyltransferase involved in cell wall biosynthesis